MDTKKLQHIAIIPDGNRRWAKEKGLLAVEGHKYASDHVLPKLYDVAKAYDIRYCTFWALSPENFVKRSSFEIHNLMLILHHFLKDKVKELNEKNIKMNVIGDIQKLSPRIQKEISEALDATKENDGMILTFAINYGGRDEIIRAVTRWAAQKGSASLTKDSFTSYLDTSDIPDPDLIIRTGGEKRTSGFMLWQSEYTEYTFLDTYFPDFTPDALKSCIEEYKERQRRYGK
jgi:undecaprenyl diphosphate synthase